MSLTSIAEDVLLQCKQIDAFMASQKLPTPSLDLDTLGNLPLDIEDVRKALVESTQKLHQIANRPFGNILELVLNVICCISRWQLSVADFCPVVHRSDQPWGNLPVQIAPACPSGRFRLNRTAGSCQRSRRGPRTTISSACDDERYVF